MKPMMSEFISAATILSAPFVTTAMKAQTVAIPFSFQVGANLYPAGAYSVERPAGGSFVSMKDENGKEVSHWVLGGGEAHPNASGIILRFDESGQIHLLRSIQFNSRVTSRLDGKAPQRGIQTLRGAM